MKKMPFAIVALSVAAGAHAQFNDIGAKKATPALPPAATLSTTPLPPSSTTGKVLSARPEAGSEETTASPAAGKQRSARPVVAVVSASSLAYLATFTSIFEEAAKP